jgi:hypothetical protein
VGLFERVLWLLDFSSKSHNTPSKSPTVPYRPCSSSLDPYCRIDAEIVTHCAQGTKRSYAKKCGNRNLDFFG